MTQSVRNRKPLPFWRTNPSWYSFEWGRGTFLTSSAPIEAVLDFERYRRTPEGKKCATVGMNDDEYERLLATVGIAHGEAPTLRLAT